MTTEIPTTCTIGPDAVSGERCGKPAVVIFRAPSGTIYAECAEHEAHRVPAAPAPKVGKLVVLRHGRIALRTRTTARYAVVYSVEGHGARIEYRTDVLARAHAYAAKHGASRRLVFDTTTGRLA